MSLEVMAVVIVSTIVSIVGAIEVSMRIIEGYAVRQKHNERKANLKYHELTKLEIEAVMKEAKTETKEANVEILEV